MTANSASVGFRGAVSPRNSRGAARPELSFHSVTAFVRSFRFSPFDQFVRVAFGAAVATGAGAGAGAAAGAGSTAATVGV